jgi:tripartite-type tricarboxylate transporter receptor subunit TctC
MPFARAVAATVAALLPAAAFAQAFPAKPVRMIIGFPAGSSSDVVGRLVAQKMGDGLGQQVIFENRPGAGGNIGAEFIAKAPADGYLLLYANTGLAVAVSAYEKLGYDALRDLVPVGQAVAGPHLLIVNLALPVQSVKDLIALAKAKPRGYNVAMTGGEMVLIPYLGGGQATVDVISGQMAAYFSGMAGGLPHVRAGKVRGLAVTTAQRSQIAPDIPTMVEAGVPGYEHVLWNAVLAPAGTPTNVVARLDAELAKAVNAPELRERFATLGVEPASRNSEQMTIYLKAEVDKYGKIVRAIGLKID